VTQSSLILTLIGPDRPGLVRMLAELVAERGGSWLESRMARLAGQFAGIVQIGIPADAIDALATALEGLADQGLRVTVQAAAEEPARPAQTTYVLEVVGNDRPGIVRDFTRALWACGVNIEELTTDVLSGSFSGETLFRASARLRGSSAEAAGQIRGALEHLGNELMVDIKPVG
jgi:glycine cleavage system regulatory protein